jgi:hypothetical protein
MDRSRFFVVVLPFEPVMPTTVSTPSSRMRRMTSVASIPSASTEFATMIWGTARSSVTCSAMTRAAPFAMAAGM